MRLPLPSDLPATLQPLVARNQQFLNDAVAAHPDLDLNAWAPVHRQQFDQVAAASDFVLGLAQREPAMLFDLLATGELERRYAPGELRGQIAAAAQAAQSDDELARNLRRARNRQQLRIIWRDITRQAELGETCRDLSDLADAAIDEAYQWLYPRHCQQFGTPIGNRSGQPQHMVVLGMGKLGAVELNLSSDIDLIFALSLIHI